MKPSTIQTIQAEAVLDLGGKCRSKIRFSKITTMFNPRNASSFGSSITAVSRNRKASILATSGPVLYTFCCSLEDLEKLQKISGALQTIAPSTSQTEKSESKRKDPKTSERTLRASLLASRWIDYGAVRVGLSEAELFAKRLQAELNKAPCALAVDEMTVAHDFWRLDPYMAAYTTATQIASFLGVVVSSVSACVSGCGCNYFSSFSRNGRQQSEIAMVHGWTVVDFSFVPRIAGQKGG